MSSFTQRMVQAAKLDVNLYEEVEADKQAMGQAMGVVILASLAAGIGSVGTTGISGILFGTVGARIGWFIWAFIAIHASYTGLFSHLLKCPTASKLS